MNEQLQQLCDNRCPSHSGILAGICAGKCWSYPKVDPHLAVTYSYCVGGCGVFGSIRDKKKARDFFEQIFIALNREGIQEFEFSCEDGELTRKVLELFQDKEIESEMEYSYRFKNVMTINVTTINATTIKENITVMSRSGKTEIAKDYKILPIDKQFLESKDSYGNVSMLQEILDCSWKNEEEFLAQSLAYAAVRGERIVGIIFGSGRYENYVAIDIEVEEAHRRKGLAEVMTGHFLAECKRRNIVAQWDCVESNIASQRLAEKAGFQLFKKRAFYWFDCTQNNADKNTTAKDTNDRDYTDRVHNKKQQSEQQRKNLFETDRLMIREVELMDADAFVEMAADGSLFDIGFDLNCGEWMKGWILEAKELADKNDPMGEYLAYTIVLKDTDQVIGSVGCSYYEDLKQVGITYFIGADYRQNGYAVEAVQAYARYFQEQYAEKNLIATIREENRPSIGVVEKAGFRLTETKWYQDIYDEKEERYRFYVMSL